MRRRTRAGRSAGMLAGEVLTPNISARRQAQQSTPRRPRDGWACAAARPDPCARSQSAQAGVGIDTEEGPAADALEQRERQKDLQSGRRIDRGRLHALVRCGAHRAGPVAALNLAKRGQGAPGELAARATELVGDGSQTLLLGVHTAAPPQCIFPMATGAQIKAEVELMLDEQDDEPLRMSELQRELESRLGLEPGSMKEHKSVLLKIVEKIRSIESDFRSVYVRMLKCLYKRSGMS